MDGRPTQIDTIPDATAKDIETLLVILARGAHRVERVEMSFGAVWIKRYGTEPPIVWTRAQNVFSRLLGQPFLRASPRLGREAMIEREVRRIAIFREHGVPVPRVLYQSQGAVVLSDAGETVNGRLARLREDEPAAHDALLVTCAADLGALHAKGLCHGRPHPRDFFLDGNRVGFMDFEEEPEAAMPLQTAQARDVLLLFLQLVDRAAFGAETAGRAYAAWRAAAPAAAETELKKILRFLGKFLWLTRLIGRVHMSSDLRRFLAATRYLSGALLPSRPADASKAGKDD
ncbi:serine/threonine protein phosphatase [Shinella sp.]|uniref:serine/threonine protein phosphatase n=1 Tax=Shinella sp. TaxID=1870904 RepID=UPI00301DC75F